MVKRMDSNRVSGVWQEFKKTKNKELKNLLAEHYLPFVVHIAEKFQKSLPSYVELADLVQEGFFGLTSAIDAFNIHRGVKFTTFCRRRIMGQMLDSLRDLDWIPNLRRQRMSAYKKALEALGNGNGYKPTVKELAKYLKVSIAEAKRIIKWAQKPIPRTIQRELSCGDRSPRDKGSQSPSQGLCDEENFRRLISFLSKYERFAVTLYYKESIELWQFWHSNERSGRAHV